MTRLETNTLCKPRVRTRRMRLKLPLKDIVRAYKELVRINNLAEIESRLWSFVFCVATQFIKSIPIRYSLSPDH